MGSIQTVSVIGQVTSATARLDYASLIVGVFVGVGTLLVALIALRGNRRANHALNEFHEWQRAQNEPFPVVTGLAVRRIRNTKLASGPLIKDGYSVTVSVHNAGRAPLLIQIAKCNFNFGESGKQGYSAYTRYDLDPLHVDGGKIEKIVLSSERWANWEHPEWPYSISLLLKYVSGRKVDGYFETWNLLEMGGPDAPKGIRLADLDRLSEFEDEVE